VSGPDELIMLSGGLAFAEPDELKAHDGVQMAEIWLGLFVATLVCAPNFTWLCLTVVLLPAAIRGKVFDVSKAAAFYGALYNCCAHAQSAAHR